MEKKSKIITIWGADSKVGVTMLCQSLSEMISQHYKEKKILLLHCDGRPGIEYANAVFERSMDDIRVLWMSRVLTISELEDACIRIGNLYMLQGVLSLKGRKLYQPGDIEELFRLAGQYFDLIFVDAGSSVDMGMAIGALLHADQRILVITQQSSCIKSFQQKNEQVLKELKITFDELIINKFTFGRFLPSERELSDKCGIKHISRVELSEFSWQAESDHTSLLAFRQKQYTQDLNELCSKLFESDRGLEGQKKQSFFLNLRRKKREREQS